MLYVLDCSVAVKWFVPEDLSDLALAVLSRFDAGELTFRAPESILAEFGHALRKAVTRGLISAERSHAIVEYFVELPIETVPMRPLAHAAMQLTTRHMSTFYDALYIALAERDNLLVLTADRPLTNAFASLDRTVHLSAFE